MGTRAISGAGATRARAYRTWFALLTLMHAGCHPRCAQRPWFAPLNRPHVTFSRQIVEGQFYPASMMVGPYYLVITPSWMAVLRGSMIVRMLPLIL